MRLILGLVLLFFCSFSNPVRAEEAPPKPPPFSKVQSILCKEYQVSASECQETIFETTSIDLNGDKKIEWVYIDMSEHTSLSEHRIVCHWRHACFSVLGEGQRGWEILLSGTGESIDFSEKRHFGYKDLIVVGSNGACSHEHLLYVWDGRRYRFKDRATCYCDGVDPVTQKKIDKPSKLCDLLPEGIVLQ